MEVFATFNIYNSTGYRVAEGHKASFCLEDNQCLSGIEPRFNCANFGDQGYYCRSRTTKQNDGGNKLLIGIDTITGLY